MRFYNYDGSCEFQHDDCNFGWWCNEICIDDNYLDCAKHNEKLRFNKSVVLMIDYKPPIFVHYPIGVKELPNYETNTTNSRSNTIVDYDLTREKLSSIVTTNSSRSKLLMSLIDFPRYKNLKTKFASSKNEIKPIGESEKPSIFLKRLLPSVLKYQSEKSLLEEIISESNHDKNYWLLCNNKKRRLNGLNKFDKLNFNQKNLSSSIKKLYANIYNLQNTLDEMKQELVFIQHSFQIEEETTIRLLKESKNLLNEINDTNYINDILFLLMGKTEAIKSNHWPFRILSKKKEPINLII